MKDREKLVSEIEAAKKKKASAEAQAAKMLQDGLERGDAFSKSAKYPQPNFTYSEEYKKLKLELDKKHTPQELQKLVSDLVGLKTEGTISRERQAEIIDEARAMSLSQLLSKCSSYREEIQRCEAEYDKLTEKAPEGKVEDYEEKRNKLLIKHWEKMAYYRAYDLALRDYIRANDELIKDEIVNAKRDEIKSSLVQLVKFING